MADAKHKITVADEKGSPPSQKAEIPTRLLSDDPTDNQYYEQFVTNGEEWRASFEKKLMRKVDLRLLPLLIIMVRVQ